MAGRTVAVDNRSNLPIESYRAACLCVERGERQCNQKEREDSHAANYVKKTARQASKFKRAVAADPARRERRISWPARNHPPRYLGGYHFSRNRPPRYLGGYHFSRNRPPRYLGGYHFSRNRPPRYLGGYHFSRNRPPRYLGGYHCSHRLLGY